MKNKYHDQDRMNPKLNEAIKIYLDYFNNYLSVDAFCLDKNITKKQFKIYKNTYYTYIN